MAEHFGYKRKYDGALVLDDINAPPMGTIKPTSISTAGAVTLTVDQIMSGLILRDCAGAVRTDTLPTAALFAGEGFLVNTGIRFSVRNISDDSAELLTIAVGSGITAQSSTDLTIEPGQTNEYMLVITNVNSGTEAATLYQVSGNNNNPAAATVTQTVDISEGVTLNAKAGIITTQTADALVENVNSFVFTNSYITASSIVLAQVVDYAGTYATNGLPYVNIDNIAAGSCSVIIANADSSAALNGVLKIAFIVYP